MTTTFQQLHTVGVPIKDACALIGRSRATHYRSGAGVLALFGLGTLITTAMGRGQRALHVPAVQPGAHPDAVNSEVLEAAVAQHQRRGEYRRGRDHRNNDNPAARDPVPSLIRRGARPRPRRGRAPGVRCL